MEFYSPIKKSEMMKLAREWMELDNRILSMETWAQKDTYHIFYLICRS